MPSKIPVRTADGAFAYVPCSPPGILSKDFRSSRLSTATVSALVSSACIECSPLLHMAHWIVSVFTAICPILQARCLFLQISRLWLAMDAGGLDVGLTKDGREPECK